VIGRLPFALDVCGGGRGLSARARTGVDGPLRLIVPSNGFSRQMRGYSAFADMVVRVRVMDRCCGFGMWWGSSGVRFRNSHGQFPGRVWKGRRSFASVAALLPACVRSVYGVFISKHKTDLKHHIEDHRSRMHFIST